MGKSKLKPKPPTAVPKAQKLSGINLTRAGIPRGHPDSPIPQSDPRVAAVGEETGSAEHRLVARSVRPGRSPSTPLPAPSTRPGPKSLKDAAAPARDRVRPFAARPQAQHRVTWGGSGRSPAVAPPH